MLMWMPSEIVDQDISKAIKSEASGISVGKSD